MRNFPETILGALKRRLRAAKLTYADVAEELGLSTSSVKRLFSEGDMSLSRLQQICDLLVVSVDELMADAQRESRHVQELSEQLEREIVSDPQRLAVLWCLINGWSVDGIVEYFGFNGPTITRVLTHLDRLGLIELFPANRVRLRLAENFRWRADGPIQRFFLSQVSREFLNSEFSADNELLIVIDGMITQSSNVQFQEQIKQLASDFRQLHRRDRQQDFNDRNATTLMIAMRPWKYSAFAQIQQNNDLHRGAVE